ncbi:MAG: hypothetical protein CME62_06005 [Halobacteriovoraceae bacterium]|nr:hypothetical protein [Halobacteriovoraceae bacterium]|tara:strand:- start:16437 stop:17585 length:1149 start_codon:yes stop_codon:yes gene_type:complete
MTNPKRVLKNLSALSALEEYEYLGKSYSDIKSELESLPLDQIFSQYSYEALAKKLLPEIQPENGELILAAIAFRNKHIANRDVQRKVEPEYAMIGDDSFDEDHYKQLDLQLRDKEEVTSYIEAVQRIAVASEFAFELICKRHDLQVVRLNTAGDYFSKEDFEVNGVRVDVKAKCHIGSKSKKYEKQLKDNASHEVMAIFYSLKDFDEDTNTFCCLLGIIDLAKLKKYNLYNVSLNYINPCLLIDFKEYFNLEKKHSLLKENVGYELLDFYLLKKKESDFPVINVGEACEYFGFHQVMNYLAQHEYFDADFKQLFDELSVPNYEFDDSIIKSYNWLVRMIQKKKIFNIVLFQRTVMKGLILTPQQAEYLNALLKVINYLPKFR